MIFGNMAHLEEWFFLENSVKECFAYTKEHPLVSYEKGVHRIDGDRLYVNILEYTTTTPEDRFWEAHRNYLDIHILLRGEERIDLNFTDRMHLREYVPAEDFLPMDGEENASVLLRPGDFLVCYPADAHRTGIVIEEPTVVKKAIFKVRI